MCLAALDRTCQHSPADRVNRTGTAVDETATCCGVGRKKYLPLLHFITGGRMKKLRSDLLLIVNEHVSLYIDGKVTSSKERINKMLDELVKFIEKREGK